MIIPAVIIQETLTTGRMKILVTSPETFTGSNLTVGAYYNVEPVCDGTAAQNKTFHKLTALYFRSGLYSYPAKTEQELKDQIKLHIGQGVEYYVYVNKDGKKRKSKMLPENVMVYKGESFIWLKLLSWGRYTKKQRADLIDGLIKEMITAGVQTKEFYEILGQLEKNSMEKIAGLEGRNDTERNYTDTVVRKI